MSDLVERLRRAFDADSVAEKNLAIRAAYDFIAAMQTDAAPALKPAVEVWEDAYRSWDDTPTDPNRIGDADQAAAAVIEADRAAIIATKDAEIAALKDAWQKQFDEKVKERDEAKLWFEKAQEWKRSLAALQAHADALAVDARSLKPYLDWTLSAESPGYHPTMPSAVAAFLEALRAYEEFRRE